MLPRIIPTGLGAGVHTGRDGGAGTAFGRLPPDTAANHRGTPCRQCGHKTEGLLRVSLPIRGPAVPWVMALEEDPLYAESTATGKTKQQPVQRH